MTISYVSAVSTENFTNSIGINTHLDFSAYSNQLSTVISDLQYIGVKNIRDSAENPADLGSTGSWQQVANATGAKFDAYAAEGSVATMQSSFQNAVTLAHQGIIRFIEGGNEEDQGYATGLGNSLATTAQFQQSVYSQAHSLGVQVINMSFGTGWSNPTGDYGTVGNLAAYTDYGNAHTYFGSGNPPASTIQSLNSDAQLAAQGKPVITTEMGWYTTNATTDVSNVTVTEQAKYMLDGLLDAYQAGNPLTYLYELIDEGTNAGYSENNFGLFYNNGTAKPAATALHNLMSLLNDSGSTAGSFTPTGLSYQLSGTLSTDHSMLMEKSDGSFWLAVWNEARLSGPTSPAQITVANHNVTLALGSAAQTIEIFDPLTGTTAVQTVSNASSVTLSVPDHPILVEIIPGGTSAGTGSTSTGSTSTGSTSTSTGSTSTSTGSTSTTATSSDLVINLPAGDTAYTSQTTKLAGVSITDAWAATHGGSVALNLSAAHGTLQISDGTTIQTGSTLHLSGTLAQLNADLATLSYVGGSATGADTVTVDVWNQAGYEQTQNLSVTIVSGSSSGTSTSTSTGSTSTGTSTGSTSTGSTSTSTGSTSTGSTSTTATSSDLAVNVPTSDTVHTSQTTKLAGVSITDAWAATHGGSMALNLSAAHGTLQISDGTTIQTGSSLHLSGSLAQLNADLATLSYVGGSATGADSVTVDVWNQGGVEQTQNLSVSIVSGSSSGTSTSTGSTSTGSTSTGSTSTALTSTDLAVIVPTVSPTAHTTAYTAITGVSISDAWAANHNGSMALNLDVSHGTMQISNGTSTLTGSSLHLSGSLAQLNADLATLHYEATALVGVDSMSVNVWNQAGVSVTHALNITVS